MLAKLPWLIQIPQIKQYYHMGLPMSKFGYVLVKPPPKVFTCIYTRDGPSVNPESEARGIYTSTSVLLRGGWLRY